MAKLFSVHLSLLVTMPTRSTKPGKPGGKRETPENVRLMIVAEDSADARQKALTWFEARSAAPTMRVEFGTGARDAISVRLANDPVSVFEESSDVVRL
jgi:hypothetical protein